MEHCFGGPSYTVGIEEELMIVDTTSLDLVSGVNAIVGEEPLSGEIKPELLESVLEIATAPCADIPAARAELATLRAIASERASEQQLAIGAAGTHPFARWEEQRVVSDDRYRGLVHSLGFVARQELVFGMHVHVGMADPEEAIRVANGLRPHVPLLIALAANSPFWRGEATGLASSRIPIFRAFPRVGLPPLYRDWEDFERRVGMLSASGIIEDYTYLWYDVRPHPRLGTVEIRAMDSQTRLDHTISLAAFVLSLVKLLVESSDHSQAMLDAPWEILDENRWLAARHGLDAELLDHVTGKRVGVRALADSLLARVASHGRELGCEAELEGIRDLLSDGNGAQWQRMVYESNHDLRELMADIVAASVP
jgi:glutamate---cysteine ligase / carboxylate-amine ligase